ncbi:MAG TPA: alpha/beta fold hydrolase [Burkholderiaceae bacterium]|jgi:polyhydroxyalkanoate synthase
MNTKGTKNIGFERLASEWLGVFTREYPEYHYSSDNIDLTFNAILGKFTGNISPGALANAYFDWLVHLDLSPSKQQRLIQTGWQKYWRWLRYTTEAAAHIGSQEQPEPCIEPLPQDKRFIAPQWRRWPFNAISQGFLLNQQWWHRATTGVHGVTEHHQEVVTFTIRQLLDMCAPSNFVLTNPVVLEETMHERGTNLMRGAVNAFADWERRLADNNWQAEEGDNPYKVGKNLAVTPGKVVFRNRLMELLQYEPATPNVHAVPLLFVPAWIMKYYILDLSPENSLVKYLVDQGYTVFMISWTNPTAEDRDLSMEDYRKLGIMDAIDVVTKITGAPQVNAVGYCLGGTLLTIAAASMARDHDPRLASMTVFASQVDFEEPGELSLFIDESQVSFLEAIMWRQGYLDSKQMAGAFQLIRSNDLIWSRRLNHYLLGIPEHKNDLMAWNADATRMPYRMHSEYLHQLFLHNYLAEGRYLTNGHHIALTDIHIPIFAVGTITDHVAPWRSAFKLLLLSDTEVTFLLTSGGHNAGVVSPPGHPHRSYQINTHAADEPYIDAETWHARMPRHEGSWWPAWEAWLAKRSGKKIKPPPMGDALADAPGTYVLRT